MSEPTRVAIRMYKLGTGDCFSLKFFHNEDIIFKMMIDCGFWSRKKEEVRPYIEELKRDVESHIDVLVVTHEHKDHVKGFESAKDLFVSNFKADQIWMGWTEDDENQTVQKWKHQYGQRKRALALAAQFLKKEVSHRSFKNQFSGTKNGAEIFAVRKSFSDSLTDFADLHVDDIESLSEGAESFNARNDDRPYIGGMEGMEIAKHEIKKDSISFFSQGEVIEDVGNLSGVKFYTLGPPSLHSEVKKEHGSGDESFEHNKHLDETDLFMQALDGKKNKDHRNSPFHESFFEKNAGTVSKSYRKRDNSWRRIDQDWLFSSGSFALRMSSLTNNLSLALAIEIGEKGKVLLFPGDAELGSWKSWHDIDWESKVPGVTTSDLLGRTIFYKVAHHLSHNGTARSLGLDHMNHPELAAMATVDYSVISSGWKNTMPNRMIVKELLEKTKGRLMIMNPEGMFYDKERKKPLKSAIEDARERMSYEEKEIFNESVKDSSGLLYIEYSIDL